MKARNILITLGVLLILMNALSFMGEQSTASNEYANSTAYFIGRNIFFIAGVILLVIAYFQHKKIIARREKDMMDNFLK